MGVKGRKESKLQNHPRSLVLKADAHKDVGFTFPVVPKLAQSFQDVPTLDLIRRHQGEVVRRLLWSNTEENEIKYPHPDIFFPGELKMKEALAGRWNPLKKKIPPYSQLLKYPLHPPDYHIEGYDHRCDVSEISEDVFSLVSRNLSKDGKVSLGRSSESLKRDGLNPIDILVEEIDEDEEDESKFYMLSKNRVILSPKGMLRKYLEHKKRMLPTKVEEDDIETLKGRRMNTPHRILKGYPSLFNSTERRPSRIPGISRVNSHDDIDEQRTVMEAADDDEPSNSSSTATQATSHLHTDSSASSGSSTTDTKNLGAHQLLSANQMLGVAAMSGRVARSTRDAESSVFSSRSSGSWSSSNRDDNSVASSSVVSSQNSREAQGLFISNSRRASVKNPSKDAASGSSKDSNKKAFDTRNLFHIEPNMSERASVSSPGPSIRDIFGGKSGYDESGRRWSQRLEMPNKQRDELRVVASLSFVEEAQQFAIKNLNKDIKVNEEQSLFSNEESRRSVDNRSYRSRDDESGSYCSLSHSEEEASLWDEDQEGSLGDDSDGSDNVTDSEEGSAGSEEISENSLMDAHDIEDALAVIEDGWKYGSCASLDFDGAGVPDEVQDEDPETTYVPKITFTATTESAVKIDDTLRTLSVFTTVDSRVRPQSKSTGGNTRSPRRRTRSRDFGTLHREDMPVRMPAMILPDVKVASVPPRRELTNGVSKSCIKMIVDVIGDTSVVSYLAKRVTAAIGYRDPTLSEELYVIATVDPHKYSTVTETTQMASEWYTAFDSKSTEIVNSSGPSAVHSYSTKKKPHDCSAVTEADEKREPKSEPVNADTNLWLLDGTQSSEEQMNRSTPPSSHQRIAVEETRIREIDTFAMATPAADSARNHIDVGGELIQQVYDAHPSCTHSNGTTKKGLVRADDKSHDASFRELECKILMAVLERRVLIEEVLNSDGRLQALDDSSSNNLSDYYDDESSSGENKDEGGDISKKWTLPRRNPEGENTSMSDIVVSNDKSLEQVICSDVSSVAASADFLRDAAEEQPQFVVATNGAVSDDQSGDQVTTNSFALIPIASAEKKPMRRSSGIFGGIDVAINMQRLKSVVTTVGKLKTGFLHQTAPTIDLMLGAPPEREEQQKDDEPKEEMRGRPGNEEGFDDVSIATGMSSGSARALRIKIIDSDRFGIPVRAPNVEKINKYKEIATPHITDEDDYHSYHRRRDSLFSINSLHEDDNIHTHHSDHGFSRHHSTHHSSTLYSAHSLAIESSGHRRFNSKDSLDVDDFLEVVGVPKELKEEMERANTYHSVFDDLFEVKRRIYATKKHFEMLLEAHHREQREEGQSSIPQEIGDEETSNASSISTNLFLEDKDVECKASKSELKAGTQWFLDHLEFIEDKTFPNHDEHSVYSIERHSVAHSVDGELPKAPVKIS